MRRRTSCRSWTRSPRPARRSPTTRRRSTTCCCPRSGSPRSGINVIGGNQPNLVRAMNILEPTTDLLIKYSPTYTCLFQGAQWFLDHGGRDALGGNGKSVIMDAALLVGDDPYRYPDNLPKVNATGGPGGRPSCGSLPDVSKNFPVKSLVTDTGFGTGLDIRPNPGIGFPGFANYFPATKAHPEAAEDPLPRAARARARCRLSRRTALRRSRITRRTARRCTRCACRPPPAAPKGRPMRRKSITRHGGAGRAVHRDVPGLHVRTGDGVRAVPVRLARRLQRGVHERVGPQGRQLRPHRRRRGRQGQGHDPAARTAPSRSTSPSTRACTLTEGTKAAVRYENLIGDRYLALEEGPGSVRRLQPGADDPAGADLARTRRRRADRRLPAAVPRAGPRPGQRAVAANCSRCSRARAAPSRRCWPRPRR